MPEQNPNGLGVVLVFDYDAQQVDPPGLGMSDSDQLPMKMGLEQSLLNCRECVDRGFGLAGSFSIPKSHSERLACMFTTCCSDHSHFGIIVREGDEASDRELLSIISTKMPHADWPLRVAPRAVVPSLRSITIGLVVGRACDGANRDRLVHLTSEQTKALIGSVLVNFSTLIKAPQ